MSVVTTSTEVNRTLQVLQLMQAFQTDVKLNITVLHTIDYTSVIRKFRLVREILLKSKRILKLHDVIFQLIILFMCFPYLLHEIKLGNFNEALTLGLSLF
jgi:hypothetical protein